MGVEDFMFGAMAGSLLSDDFTSHRNSPPQTSQTSTWTAPHAAPQRGLRLSEKQRNIAILAVEDAISAVDFVVGDAQSPELTKGSAGLRAEFVALLEFLRGSGNSE